MIYKYIYISISPFFSSLSPFVFHFFFSWAEHATCALLWSLSGLIKEALGFRLAGHPEIETNERGVGRLEQAGKLH